MIKRILSLILLGMMLLGATGYAQTQQPSSIRVWLRRMKAQEALRIEVQGNYMLENGSMYFPDGTVLDVVLRENQLVLHHGTIAVVMGQSMKLIRCMSEKNSGLRLNGGSGLYEGDLTLDIRDDVIRPILNIYIEDYLLGVVPYEMGDSFPLEALKAQAIAARTYALKRIGRTADYDVEDTTNDQAYKGRSTKHPLSEQAVRETEGLCGLYRGKLANCYYSASNGGQTELGQNVWPSNDPDAYGYMEMRDDPFDLENEASIVKRFTLRKKLNTSGVDAALQEALVRAMAHQLEEKGIPADVNLVRIDEVLGVQTAEPKYEAPSKLVTQLILEIKISTRNYVTPPGLETNETAQNQETVPTATHVYSPYKQMEGTWTVHLPLFPDAEKAMGLSINASYENELVTAYDIGSAFVIESRRFGHGVGMSQRGAQQMARKYGMTFRQILSFYYPGMEVSNVNLVPKASLPQMNASLMATPVPTPEPTPKPTLIPVDTTNLPEHAYLAKVSYIEMDSTLNLRVEPNLSADVIRRLGKDQLMIVLGTDTNGWARVKMDGIEGYVRNEYLEIVQ